MLASTTPQKYENKEYQVQYIVNKYSDFPTLWHFNCSYREEPKGLEGSNAMAQMSHKDIQRQNILKEVYSRVAYWTTVT